MTKVLVTGSAGFIGYHLCRLLLAEGFEVIGLDALTDYYSVEQKKRLHQMLGQNEGFTSVIQRIEAADDLAVLCKRERPEVIIHLAAQAGVRYSLENPRAYIDTNLVGTFNVMECAREIGVRHLLMASTQASMARTPKCPIARPTRPIRRLRFMPRPKKPTRRWRIPMRISGIFRRRCFDFSRSTGRGGGPTWRPTSLPKASWKVRPIDIYNHGQMFRDFTYVEDLVRGVRLLIDAVPPGPGDAREILEGDSLSPVASVPRL